MKKAVKLLGKVIALGTSFFLGAFSTWVHEEKRLDQSEDTFKKMNSFYNLLVEWLKLKQDGINLAEYFEFNNYHTVALYGMKELGERFVEELKGTDIEIKYLIDKNADNIVTDLPKYHPDDDLPIADVIVVSAIYYFQEIQEELEKKTNIDIISLEDVVYGLD